MKRWRACSRTRRKSARAHILHALTAKSAASPGPPRLALAVAESGINTSLRRTAALVTSIVPGEEIENFERSGSKQAPAGSHQENHDAVLTSALRSACYSQGGFMNREEANHV